MSILSLPLALGLEIQINVQVPETKGLMVECNSGGWYPQPKMNWRDSRGNVIPASSKIFSEDRAGLLHLKTSVQLKNSTHGSITCCFYNSVTSQEKRASIVLPGECGLVLPRKSGFHQCDKIKIKLGDIIKEKLLYR